MLTSDSSFSSPPSCGRADAVRDYAFGELPAGSRPALEQHLAECPACASELDRLQLTAAALRTLPDREIPQRIAFVSDRVFEPSALRRFWSSGGPAGARLGFASACVLALAMVVSAWHISAAWRPAGIQTGSQTASSRQQIDAAVAAAVAQASVRIAAEIKAEIKVDEARTIQAAIHSSQQARDREYRDQMIAIEENLMVLRKRLDMSYAKLSSNDVAGLGAGQ